VPTNTPERGGPRPVPNTPEPTTPPEPPPPPPPPPDDTPTRPQLKWSWLSNVLAKTPDSN
jgi:hypothetical protein